METDKPYLNSDLNISEMAHKLSVPSHLISQVLSQGFQLNFYHYVNRYRIEESKRILAEKGDEKTVLEILYETGFNSKSTFNRIFKQYTGVNPTEFVNSQKD
jgi:AraC-like DNA-binding protein